MNIRRIILLAMGVMLTACASAWGSVAINYTTFPDSSFRSYVSSTFDEDSDGTLSDAEITAAVAVNVRNRGISDLTGIEYFTNLVDLYCNNNNLTAIDVSSNTLLSTFYCSSNNLAALDVSGNAYLLNLQCQNNALTMLDVSTNSRLTHLTCSGQAADFSGVIYNGSGYQIDLGGISSGIDVSKISSLDIIGSADTSIAFTRSGDIVYVDELPSKVAYCYDTGFTDTFMDVSLSVSSAGGVVINEAIFPDSVFRAYVKTNFDSDNDSILNASEISSAVNINVNSSGISSLKGVEYFTALTNLSCSGNSLTDLVLGSNTTLTTLDCSNNNLLALDLSGLSYLTSVTCGSQTLALPEPASSDNTSYPYMIDFDALFTSLDVSVSFNEFISSAYSISVKDYYGDSVSYSYDSAGIVYFSDKPKTMTYTYYTGSYYGSMNVTLTFDGDANHPEGIAVNESSFPDAAFRTLVSEDLDTDSNGYLSASERSSVTELDVSNMGIYSLTGINHFTSLLSLNCSSNYIYSLSLSSCTNLVSLDCSNNDIYSLSLNHNSALRYLNCSNNDISYLYVTNCTELETLDCSGNRLAALNLSSNTGLKILDCSDNRLAVLNLTSNTELSDILCTSQDVSISGLELVSNSVYPYTVNLSTERSYLGISTSITDFISNVSGLSITDKNGGAVTHSTDISAGIVYFASEPSTISYVYDTGRDSMDVSVTVPSVPDLTAAFSPSTQTIYTGGTITAIVLSVSNSTGSYSVSYGTLPDGLSWSGSSVSGSLDAAGTYTITASVADKILTSRTASATATIVVQPKTPPVPDTPSDPVEPASITGVRITDPESKIITLSADGGSFTATAAVSGTPYGEIAWDISAPSSLNASWSASESEALISGTAPVNDSSADVSYSVTVTAKDGYNIEFRDTLTVIVKSRIPTIPPDPSDDIGIKGITLSSTQVNLPADGGAFSVTASAIGTPSGDVTWTWESELGSGSGTGLEITISGTAKPNEDDKIDSYTVSVTAEDAVRPVDASFTVTVDGKEPPTPDDRGDSWENPIVLNSAADFEGVMQRINEGTEAQGMYYAIRQEIDLSSVSAWNGIGTERNPFTGHFEGSNNTITTAGSSQTVFGVISSDGVAVRNLRVSRLSVANNKASASDNASSSRRKPVYSEGGIVNELLSGSIENCTFSGNISVDGDNTSAGGIVGELSGGTITNCRVLSGSSVSASNSAGGIAGYVSSGRISGCLSSADVSASYAGGIAGYSETPRRNIRGNKSSIRAVGNYALALEILPASQVVSADSAVQDILVSSDTEITWSFRVSGDYELGLSSQDVVITGKIPADTPAGTYTLRIMAADSEDLTASAYAFITVVRSDVPPSERGITGITITSPDSKRLTLPSSGGNFGGVIVTAQGTPSGTVSWDFEPVSGLTLNITRNGSSAVLSGRAPANTDSQDKTYSVRISAHDQVSGTFSDTFTLIVWGTAHAPAPKTVIIYEFEIPSGVRDRLRSRFNEEIYQFSDDEILSETWTLSDADYQAITSLNERVLVHLPSVRPQNSGIYLLRLEIPAAEAGKAVKLYGITDDSSGGNVTPAALEGMEYIFLDEDGNEITEVPENGIVYTAMRLTAGREHRGVVTAPAETGGGTIQPVELGNDVLERIAEVINRSADEIKFITEENISEPKEATQNIADRIAQDKHEIIGTFNTLTVSEDGYYVFKVTLTDELYEDIRGVKITDLKAYVLYDDGRGGESNVSGAFINGLASTWELLTLSGEKLEFGAKEFLMVGFLNAGTPFSVYLTKILLALLVGGCESGLGLAALVTLCAFFFRKH